MVSHIIFLLLYTVINLIAGPTISLAIPNGRRTVDVSGPHHRLFDPRRRENRVLRSVSTCSECTFENYACSNRSSENLLQTFDDVQAREGCKQRCFENSECSWWTHFNGEYPENPNQCLLFRDCTKYAKCDPIWSCYSATPDCTYGGPNASVILGGIDDHGDNVTTVEVFEENCNKSVCNVIPNIPSSMAYKNRASAVVAAKIYGCGGEGSHDKEPTKNCMVLNVLNQHQYEWKSSADDIPPMQEAVTSAAAIGAYGELYIFGGSNVITPNVLLIDSVSTYNPETKTWRYLDSRMKHARAGHCAVLKKDVVYLIGGNASENSKYMSVDTYNITSKQWETYSLEEFGVENRMGHACSRYHNQIIVSGGSCDTDWNNVLNSVLSIDLTPGESYMNVTKLPNMNYSRMSHGMTIYKDNPYVIGGHGTSGEYIDENEILRDDESSWDVNGELQAARSHFSIAGLDPECLPERSEGECM